MHGKHLATALIAALLAVGSALASDSLFFISDDFDSTVRSDFWYLIEPDPDNEKLVQSGGRLEFRSTSKADQEGAFYLLRKNRLSTSADFAMEVDWNLLKAKDFDSGWVLLGLAVLPDTFIEIRAGFSTFLGGRFIHVEGFGKHGTFTNFSPVLTKDFSGKFFINYDAATDTLFLSANDANSSSLPGDFVLDNVFGATAGFFDVTPYIGGTSDGMKFKDGDVFLDNFVIFDGIILIPKTRDLTVTSDPNDGVTIEVSPLDNDDNGDGTTPFERSYDEDVPVTLTAPQFDGFGNGFARWRKDKDSKRREITVDVDSDIDLEAVYEPVTLTIDFPTDSGIVLQRGMKYNILWESAGLSKKDDVTITLVKGGTERFLIKTVSNKGKFKWKVDGSFPDGDDYQIELAQPDAPITETSSSNFAIASLTGLTISGPATVNEFSNGQFTATGSFNFGPDQDLTRQVKWSLSSGKTAKISQSGLLTGKKVLADTPVEILVNDKKNSAVFNALTVTVLNTVPN